MYWPMASPSLSVAICIHLVLVPDPSLFSYSLNLLSFLTWGSSRSKRAATSLASSIKVRGDWSDTSPTPPRSRRFRNLARGKLAACFKCAAHLVVCPTPPPGDAAGKMADANRTSATRHRRKGRSSTPFLPRSVILTLVFLAGNQKVQDEWERRKRILERT